MKRRQASSRRRLLDDGIDYFSPCVCENLGTPNERVTRGTLSEIANQTFAPLNVLVLLRDSAAPDKPRELTDKRLFGNPEEAFLQSKPKEGLLTSAEVRTMALAEQMAVQSDSIVWDIGAGSGSVSVEAAMLARDGQVFAIEMDPDEHELIRENAARFAVGNITSVFRRPPRRGPSCPTRTASSSPARGGKWRIVSEAFERLKTGGRLVANVGSVENLADLHATMSRSADDVRVWMINIARGTYQLRTDPIRRVESDVCAVGD